jgi:hypothetical protein
MSDINNSVEFAGFEPDNGVRKSICQTLDVILGCAPSDASSSATMRKTREGFEGSLRLNSQAGTFAARVFASNPVEAMQRLNERIFEQIRSWRSHRRLANEVGA